MRMFLVKDVQYACAKFRQSAEIDEIVKKHISDFATSKTVFFSEFHYTYSTTNADLFKTLRQHPRGALCFKNVLFYFIF